VDEGLELWLDEGVLELLELVESPGGVDVVEGDEVEAGASARRLSERDELLLVLLSLVVLPASARRPDPMLPHSSMVLLPLLVELVAVLGSLLWVFDLQSALDCELRAPDELRLPWVVELEDFAGSEDVAVDVSCADEEDEEDVDGGVVGCDGEVVDCATARLDVPKALTAKSTLSLFMSCSNEWWRVSDLTTPGSLSSAVICRDQRSRSRRGDFQP
jgi:hypothetical protein